MCERYTVGAVCTVGAMGTVGAMRTVRNEGAVCAVCVQRFTTVYSERRVCKSELAPLFFLLPLPKQRRVGRGR